MSITIQLSADDEKRLAQRTARSGRDLTGYVHLLIERDIQPPAGADEAIAPFRRQVEECGLSDGDLGDFFEEVQDEVWREKHERPSQLKPESSPVGPTLTIANKAGVAPRGDFEGEVRSGLAPRR